ncbi:6,7-dimethyl-8-ribityllumazine synthase [Nitriliruptoraceae bacterium ZYF776]|nr:6,7-dimethyl-8-ribityllumazine synthase [Profundirhabdus halotolerans]
MSQPRPDGVRVDAGSVDAAGLRVGIVAARFNEAIVERLVDGAVDALLRHRALVEDVRVAWVPGAFELPVALRALAAGGEVDALVALGCVVRGATPHFDYVAGECASGSAAVAREFGLPIAFGVLTTDTWDQAVERAGGKLGNKGAESALAAVETARLLQGL